MPHLNGGNETSFSIIFVSHIHRFSQQLRAPNKFPILFFVVILSGGEVFVRDEVRVPVEPESKLEADKLAPLFVFAIFKVFFI